MEFLTRIALAVALFFVVRGAWQTYLASAFARKQRLRCHSFFMDGVPGPAPGLSYVPDGPALAQFSSMQLVVKTSLFGVLPGHSADEWKVASECFSTPSVDTTCIYVTDVRRVDGTRWEVRSIYNDAWVPLSDRAVPALDAAYQLFLHRFVPLTPSEEEWGQTHPAAWVPFRALRKQEDGKVGWASPDWVPEKVRRLMASRFKRAGTPGASSGGAA